MLDIARDSTDGLNYSEVDTRARWVTVKMDLYLATTQKTVVSLMKFTNESDSDEFKRQKAMAQVLLEQANVFESLIQETKDLQQSLSHEETALETRITEQQ